MLNDDIYLGQHQLRQWLVCWRHQAINWTNVYLSSARWPTFIWARYYRRYRSMKHDKNSIFKHVSISSENQWLHAGFFSHYSKYCCLIHVVRASLFIFCLLDGIEGPQGLWHDEQDISDIPIIDLARNWSRYGAWHKHFCRKQSASLWETAWF